MTVPAPVDQTPDERALAQRLARLGPRGEPSPQLDARVLAAARTALDEPARPTHRPRRWPVALGVAASLVLAVGLAWRLRPLPPGSTAAPATSVHPAPAAAPAVSAPQANAAPLASEPAATTPDARTTPPTAVDASTVVEPPTPPDNAQRRTAKNVATAAPPVDVQTGEPTTVILDAPAPPATPQRLQKTEADQGAAAEATGADEADEPDRAATSDAQPEAGDEPLDAMPPATADAPGVRDAWLSRIRALIDSGDVPGGRRSLRAFVERYPDYTLPEDLRALQQ